MKATIEQCLKRKAHLDFARRVARENERRFDAMMDIDAARGHLRSSEEAFSSDTNPSEREWCERPVV